MKNVMKIFVALIIVFVIATGSIIANHKFRTVAQKHEIIYETMLVLDLMDFVATGGGFLGYSNYFKWCYAKWRNSDRTMLEKALFWNFGVLYDAISPLKEYRYPLEI
ncbi:hypothetical protein J7J13_04310 [bacterium]|nr:hypothetical protein [bacterium]